MPGGSAIALFNQKLTEEIATSSRIRSKATRRAVEDALQGVRTSLQRFANKAPENGLAIFSGFDSVSSRTILECLDDLPAPIKSPLYRCDKRFHLDLVSSMLMAADTYGFVVFDGSGCLVATLNGNLVRVLAKIDAFLPKKHSKGGQSAPRFQHLRLEQRMMFRKRAEELICKHFIDPISTRPNVDGIVIAGSSGYKNELQLDHRLSPLIKSRVTVQYSGRSGLNEAISRSTSVLGDVALLREKQLLSEFFSRIDRDLPVAFGPRATIEAIEQHAIEMLILAEEYSDMLFSEMSRSFVARNEARDDAVPLAELFEGRITIVSSNSPEGQQFTQGFGGFGALLRFATLSEPSCSDNEDDEEEEQSFE